MVSDGLIVDWRALRAPSPDGADCLAERWIRCGADRPGAVGFNRSVRPATRQRVLHGYAPAVCRRHRARVHAPARWDEGEWLVAAGAGGLALGTTVFDRSIRDSVQARRSAGLDRFCRSFEHLGADYSFVVLAGFEGYHFLADDRRSQAVFVDGLAASLIASGFIAPILKYSVGRERPSDTTDPYSFHPFTNHNSFPSGHTTQAFYRR
jgi:hypothetical protein